MERKHPVVVLVISLLIGLLIAVFPLPTDIAYLRPEVVCMLVAYWVMQSPQHLGMFFAWSVGLVQDIVEATVWGAHALALTLLAYICLMSYQRIRNYSVWHQSMWIFILVGTHQVVVNWVQGIAGYRSPTQLLLLPTIMSALCWPLIVFIFHRIRVRYRLA
ncbi:rod shape-determining protein MreD [Teredinibacter haidensis]|uniref:rod shape-determining protein MreD n=1 Tax=Teredinibacter haidensis TaxID=2731755 RepID=UPI000948AF14|nr:rod shape-determining protein MreD [Teredinibacter haidensis]